MRDNWLVYSRALNGPYCDNLVQELKQIDANTAITFNSSENYRKSQVRWVTQRPDIVSTLMWYVNDANATTFNVDIQQEMGELQFTEYDADYQGKYDWHHDVFWENPKNFDRKLTIVVQLSDPIDYSGGSFEFLEVPTPGNEIKPKGSILIFPSYLQHRVTQLTAGTRYSLVSWVRGPRWR